MRLNRANTITREVKPKALLPEVIQYLSNPSSQLNNSLPPGQMSCDLSQKQHESSRGSLDFLPFCNERDGLGRLNKYKSVGQFSSIFNSDIEIGLSSNQKDVSNIQTPSLEKKISLPELSKNKVKLSKVAFMHLNEFLNEKISTSKRNMLKMKLDVDELIDDIGTERSGSHIESMDRQKSSQLIPLELESTVPVMSKKHSLSSHILSFQERSVGNKQQHQLIAGLDISRLFKFQDNKFSAQTEKFVKDIANLYTQPRKKLFLQVNYRNIGLK